MFTENATLSSATMVRALNRPRLRIGLGEPDENGRCWQTLPPIAALGFYPGGSTDERTAVRALAGDRAMFVRFDCRLIDVADLGVPAGGSVNGPQREMATVSLCPANDPTQWLILTVDYKGVRDFQRVDRVPSEMSLTTSADVWQKSAPANLLGVQTCYGVCGASWFVELEIPWRAMGLTGRPSVMGFRLSRVFGGSRPPLERQSVWPDPTRPDESIAVLEPGEAIIGPDAGAPQCVEFSPPRFGANTARLVRGSWWPASARTLTVSTQTHDGKLIASQTVDIDASPDAVPFNFWLDRAQSSYFDNFTPARLVLEAKNGDATLYLAALPMDRHLGLLVDEPYAEPGSFEPAPLLPATARDTWLDRVIRKLPRLHRAATPQGAPSDFCLMNADGSLVVNLVADDAWQRLAAIIESRFSNAEDRLVAAMALIGQKSVTNLIICSPFYDHSGNPTYHSMHHELMGPLSILRYGGGPAVARAAVLARLLQHVKNPATGNPFVTRVIALAKDGGPKQTLRKYLKGEGLAPFVQFPGYVGAVAVDHGGSQTLIDPSALAFFPASESRLADVEAIASDATLRTVGAGRMADIFGRIDIEEIRRQPADRLLSRGVFPELMPDEVGPNRPFDMSEHQTPPVLRANEDSLATTPRPEESAIRRADVSVSTDDRGLRVRVAVRRAAMAQLNERDRQHERVHVLLDTRHEHVQFVHFVAALGGERGAWIEEASGIQTLFKNLSSENHSQIADLAGAAWSVRIDPRNDGYDAEFDLPWDTLRSDASDRPATMGLNVWLDCRHPHYEQAFIAPPRRRLPADPFTFADLYLKPTPVTVVDIDLGVPTWGRNTGRATFENHSSRDVVITLNSSNSLSMRRRVMHLPETTVKVPARSRVDVQFPYYVDSEERMSGAQQRIILAGTCNGSRFFDAAFRIGYCGPLSTYHRYGRQVEPCPNPRFGEPDYLDRKSRYICSRLPGFKRVTTRDGAPSDFVIRAEDGTVEFNLMEAGALDRIGTYIATLFDNDLDRVLGLYFFKMCPAVMRHLSSGHRFMGNASPLSAMRGSFAGGGGNCGYNSRTFSGMASHLVIAGTNLIAHTNPIHGHNIGAFAFSDQIRRLIDPDVGHFFLNSKGELASLQDMLSDPGVTSTAGPGERARYYSFNLERMSNQLGFDDNTYTGIFPFGAPRA